MNIPTSLIALSELYPNQTHQICLENDIDLVNRPITEIIELAKLSAEYNKLTDVEKAFVYSRFFEESLRDKNLGSKTLFRLFDGLLKFSENNIVKDDVWTFSYDKDQDLFSHVTVGYSLIYQSGCTNSTKMNIKLRFLNNKAINDFLKFVIAYNNSSSGSFDAGRDQMLTISCENDIISFKDENLFIECPKNNTLSACLDEISRSISEIREELLNAYNDKNWLNTHIATNDNYPSKFPVNSPEMDGVQEITFHQPAAIPHFTLSPNSKSNQGRIKPTFNR